MTDLAAQLLETLSHEADRSALLGGLADLPEMRRTQELLQKALEDESLRLRLPLEAERATTSLHFLQRAILGLGLVGGGGQASSPVAAAAGR